MIYTSSFYIDHNDHICGIEKDAETKRIKMCIQGMAEPNKLILSFTSEAFQAFADLILLDCAKKWGGEKDADNNK